MEQGEPVSEADLRQASSTNIHLPMRAFKTLLLAWTTPGAIPLQCTPLQCTLRHALTLHPPKRQKSTQSPPIHVPQQTRRLRHANPITSTITPLDHTLMQEALTQARTAFNAGEVPVGAVLVSRTDNAILSRAHNDVEAHTDCTRHAEMLCLSRAMASRSNWRLSETTLYVTLEPCAMCLSAAALARVSRIVYGAPDLRLGACGSWMNLLEERPHPFHTFTEVVGGVCADEAAQLMKEFFRRRRTQPSRKKKKV